MLHQVWQVEAGVGRARVCSMTEARGRHSHASSEEARRDLRLPGSAVAVPSETGRGRAPGKTDGEREEKIQHYYTPLIPLTPQQNSALLSSSYSSYSPAELSTSILLLFLNITQQFPPPLTLQQNSAHLNTSKILDSSTEHLTLRYTLILFLSCISLLLHLTALLMVSSYFPTPALIHSASNLTPHFFIPLFYNLLTICLFTPTPLHHGPFHGFDGVARDGA
ncbi:hypothetical protein E2C01_026315 [Portunus trituberculatus]|uniref:Uncharacterized protein n=1 Tax=Portunus trituberculatus TaxID=210409 RepID=A0A5B7EI85_PORTR|nr:hypothetical protein [Portunus trituberculatus]